MKSGEERAHLDEKIRPILRQALADGFEPAEIVYLLTRMLPEACSREFALSNVVAAYDLYDQRKKNRS